MNAHDDDRADAGWDPERIADELQRRRLAAGNISFGEIAVRIAARREARGLAASAARIARSTVYDVFRPGRSRLNHDLVAEIVLVLGGTDADAQLWRARCVQATSRQTAQSEQPHPPISAATLLRADPGPIRAALRPGRVGTVLVLCVALNLLGSKLALALSLPLFLDMIGTAVSSIAFGPWFGVMVALASNGLTALLTEPEAILYTAVNVAGALLWGYGVRSWRLGETVLRFLLLTVIVAVACTLISVPITMGVFDGFSPHVSGSALTANIVNLGEGLWGAAFWSNIVISLIDKLIAGFIALAVTPQISAWAIGPRGSSSPDALSLMRAQPGQLTPVI